MSDLIDRQAAIEALKPCAGVGNRALDKLRALPSAEPQWIPCSERLPEDGKIVLVSACFFEPLVFRAYLEGGEWIGEEATHWSQESVYAWMPLPKPYEERREDDC